jgi:hypothetical protein
VATDARERLIADSQFGSGVITITAGVPIGGAFAPATWWLGLSKTTPNEDGTNFTEPVALGYARIAVLNDSTKFRPAVTTLGVTTKSNLAKFTFANPTGTWGLMTDYGWFLASTGGTPEYTHALDVPITVQNGNTPVEFDVDQLVMVWD